MSNEESIRELLNDAVQAIIAADNNPRTWLS